MLIERLLTLPAVHIKARYRDGCACAMVFTQFYEHFMPRLLQAPFAGLKGLFLTSASNVKDDVTYTADPSTFFR